MSPLENARRAAPPAARHARAASRPGAGSFFLAYLRNELIGRRRQTATIALGLAVGIGLAIAVTAASAGVARAQAQVLHALYGIGTDVTVTAPAAASNDKGAAGRGDLLTPIQGQGTLKESAIAELAHLSGVAAAAGGLTLSDTRMDAPAGVSAPPVTFTVEGVDVANLGLGPFASARPASGRSFTAADADASVGVVDAAYARAQGLAVGSKVVVAGRELTVVGLVQSTQATGETDVFLPLHTAQRLSRLTGQVNAGYIRAASNSDLGAVRKAIAARLPHATVTSAANLADAVNGSLASAAKLAAQLGRWLSAATLIAAFAAASLLTIAAVDRRVREFGTLKALGWSSRRIVAQVMGESLVIGVVGAALGILLGLAGSVLVRLAAPALSAVVPGTGSAANQSHVVSVHLTAPVTLTTVLLAAPLAVAGGVVAGAVGGWRAARLRPVEALRRVG
jgi:putative ABC transport system permease protein